MSIIEKLNNILKFAKQNGAEGADAFAVKSRSLSTSVRLGKIENLEEASSFGLGLRVQIGQRQATISTSDIDNKEELEQLTHRALTMARHLPDDPHLVPYAKQTASSALAVRDLELYDPNQPSAQWLYEKAIEMEEIGLNVPGISNSSGADASHSHNEIYLCTSHGFIGSYQSSATSLSISLVARNASDAMERDYDSSVARFVCDLRTPSDIAKQAASKTLKRLDSIRLPTGEATIIFDPRVSRSLLGIFLNAINGAAIARKTSFLQSALHQPVFAPSITILDDPFRLRGLASRPFDAEGHEGSALTLVKEGIIQDWLLDSRTANQLKCSNNFRAQRGFSSPPSPTSTNAYIAPSLLSPTELLSQVHNGFYVTELFGMGVNMITGDYSQGAAGFRIENGTLTQAVSEVTIAGQLQDMFKRMIAANDLTFRYSTNSPTLAIEGMMVAGKD
jgi:PmbA protein